MFNYDLPQDARDYVHRISRTARLGADGDAISFDLRHVCAGPARHRGIIIGQKIPVERVEPGCDGAPPPRVPARAAGSARGEDDGSIETAPPPKQRSRSRPPLATPAPDAACARAAKPRAQPGERQRRRQRPRRRAAPAAQEAPADAAVAAASRSGWSAGSRCGRTTSGRQRQRRTAPSRSSTWSRRRQQRPRAAEQQPGFPALGTCSSADLCGRLSRRRDRSATVRASAECRQPSHAESADPRRPRTPVTLRRRSRLSATCRGTLLRLWCSCVCCGWRCRVTTSARLPAAAPARSAGRPIDREVASVRQSAKRQLPSSARNARRPRSSSPCPARHAGAGRSPKQGIAMIADEHGMNAATTSANDVASVPS